jgi:hypothetical protein
MVAIPHAAEEVPVDAAPTTMYGAQEVLKVVNDQDVTHPIQGLFVIDPMNVPCLESFREALIGVVGTTGDTAETVVTTMSSSRGTDRDRGSSRGPRGRDSLAGHQTEDKALREEADAVRSPAIHGLSVELQTQKNDVTASPAPITSTTTWTKNLRSSSVNLTTRCIARCRLWVKQN